MTDEKTINELIAIREMAAALVQKADRMIKQRPVRKIESSFIQHRQKVKAKRTA